MDGKKEGFWDWMGPKRSSTMYGVIALGAGVAKVEL